MNLSNELPENDWRNEGLSTAANNLLVDSVTIFLSAGFYRMHVLYRGRSIAENYIVKGYPTKSRWCVLSSDNRLQTHVLFKTLREARDFCLQSTHAELT